MTRMLKTAIMAVVLWGPVAAPTAMACEDKPNEPAPCEVILRLDAEHFPADAPCRLWFGEPLIVRWDSLEPNDQVTILVDHRRIKADAAIAKETLRELPVGEHRIRLEAFRRTEVMSENRKRVIKDTLTTDAYKVLVCKPPRPNLAIASAENRVARAECDYGGPILVSPRTWLHVSIDRSDDGRPFEFLRGDQLVFETLEDEDKTPESVARRVPIDQAYLAPDERESCEETEGTPELAAYVVPRSFEPGRFCQVRVAIERKGVCGPFSSPLWLQVSEAAIKTPRTVATRPAQNVQCVESGKETEAFPDVADGWRYAFPCPVHFAEPCHGGDNQRCDGSKVLITEGMRFSLNEKGEYFVEFMVFAQRSDVTLSVELCVSDSCEQKRTITLLPVELGADGGGKEQATRQYTVRYRGSSPSLLGLDVDKLEVTRSGTARFH